MHLWSNTGAPILLAGLTIPTGEGEFVDLSFDRYMADEARRTQINDLYLEDKIAVDMQEDDGDNHFPQSTAGELEDLDPVAVRVGERVYLSISIPGVLTVADSADTVVVPVPNGKIIGLAGSLGGPDPEGADLKVTVKKNGTDVFAGHVADYLDFAAGSPGQVVQLSGPAFGEDAYNAANQSALACELGDVLRASVTAIGTTSGHHGADLKLLVCVQITEGVSIDD